VDALRWLVDAARAPRQAEATLHRIAGRRPLTVAPAGAAEAPGRLPVPDGPAVLPTASRGAAPAASPGRSDRRAVRQVLAAVRRWAPRLERLDPAGELAVLDRYGGTLLHPHAPGSPTRPGAPGRRPPPCLGGRRET